MICSSCNVQIKDAFSLPLYGNGKNQGFNCPACGDFVTLRPTKYAIVRLPKSEAKKKEQGRTR